MTRSSLVPLLLAVLEAGCQRPAPTAAPSTDDRPPGATGTAELSGRVRFHGPAPADIERPSKLAFPECSGFGPPDPSLSLSPEGGVSQAFVWIAAGLPPGTYPVPSAPVLLDQVGCEFRPRVFGVRTHQRLQLRNSDPVLHNTHAYGSTFSGGFNVPLPRQGDTATRTLDQPGVPAPIGCDIHGWMRAYAGVVDHPFFAVTDAAGAFRIAGLPAGQYTVEAWHERLGRVRGQVAVPSGGRASLDLAFPGP